MKPNSEQKRFWSRIDVSLPDESCWFWHAKRPDGQVYVPWSYPGFILDSGVHVRASHYAWSDMRGPVPVGTYMCHKCDTPPCINPGHLFPGTQADNMLDMSQKRRSGFVPEPFSHVCIPSCPWFGDGP